MRVRLIRIGICIVIGVGISVSAQGAVKTFTGTGNWNESARWAPSVPLSGDDAIIDGAVTLTNTTVVLTSYTLNGTRSHIFAGSNTILRATNVTISGTMTHDVNCATDTNALGEWENGRWTAASTSWRMPT